MTQLRGDRPGPPRLAAWLLRLTVRDAAASDGILGDLMEEHEADLAGGGETTRARFRLFLAILGVSARFLFLPRAEVRHPTPASVAAPAVTLTLLRDLRAALRSLLRSPAFTATAVITIAVGIGATTAVFSVVESIVLRPLPYRDADRLVNVSHLTKEGTRLLASWFDLPDLRRESEVFEGVAASAAVPQEVVLTDDAGGIYQVSALFATYNYLSVLGVEAAVGRTFVEEDAVAAEGSPDEDEDEDAPEPVRSAVIGYGLWQRLGGNPDLASRKIYLTLPLQSVQIVGVLPPDFQLLNARSYRRLAGTDVDVFFVMPEGSFHRGRPDGSQARNALVLGRLREGIDYERAQAAMDALAARYRAEIPYYGEGELSLPIHFLREDLTEGTGPMIMVLAGGLLFLMLLVCTNVGNLMLVRGYIHSGEDAIRATLGCGRFRLVARKLWECGLMAIAGGGFGILLGWIAIRMIEVLGPRNIPLLDQVEMNAPTAVMGITASLLAGAVFGLFPSLQTRRLAIGDVLRNDTGRGSVRGRRRLMRLLVVTELALSTVLVSGALLMVRSVIALTEANLGYDPDGLVSFDLIPIEGGRFDPSYSWASTFRQLEERLAAIPGVASVARTSKPPLSGRGPSGTYGGTPEQLETQAYRADISMVTRNYFETMGTRLLAGRTFDESDEFDGSTAIIVDKALADIAWPDEDPLGKTLYRAANRRGSIPWASEATVVGVVESMYMRDTSTVSAIRGGIYQPEPLAGWAETFIVRTEIDPASVTGVLREAVRSVDPGLTAFGIQDLSARIAMTRAPTRFILFVMSSFAVVALIVALGGLFGVVSYTVRTRTSEFGLRMALGADSSIILSMILKESSALVTAGVVAGVGGTLLVSRVLSSVAYEVTATDPLTLAATALALGVSSVIACCAPAVWAGRVDPVKALAS